MKGMGCVILYLWLMRSGRLVSYGDNEKGGADGEKGEGRREIREMRERGQRGKKGERERREGQGVEGVGRMIMQTNKQRMSFFHNYAFSYILSYIQFACCKMSRFFPCCFPPCAFSDSLTHSHSPHICIHRPLWSVLSPYIPFSVVSAACVHAAIFPRHFLPGLRM